MTFRMVSDDGNLSAQSDSREKIFLTYKPTLQVATLTRNDAYFLAQAITDWIRLGNDPGYYARATQRNVFGILAEDETRMWIWYELQQQGSWLSRSDAVWLAGAIFMWLGAFD